LEVVALVDIPPRVHRPERSRVELSNPQETDDFMRSAYGAKLRVSRRSGPPLVGSVLLSHARIDVGQFAIDELHVPGDLETAQDGINKVVAAWVTGGRVRVECGGIVGGAAAGEITLMALPELPNSSSLQDLSEIAVLLDPAVVAGVAAGVPGAQAPAPIRFSSFAPADAVLAQGWKNTVSYVKDVVLADDALATPLVLGQAARLLAAVTLSTFPNSASAEPRPHDRTDHQPVLLRRAIDYIEANLAADIGSADIAAVIRVTPRALQYMFRRHLDTTPLQYLRRLRLHHAHRDLVAADPRHDTVAAIAARWGFMHAGRFAVYYHHAYGQSPGGTLRGSVLSDEGIALLLRTLWTYRGVGGDLTRAAAVLMLNRSTVRYRLHRIREVTGLSPNDPRAVDALRELSRR
jgi:AraC-like DNA-binding protein